MGTRTSREDNPAARRSRARALLIVSAFICSPALANHCIDEDASAPGLVRIRVWIEAAEASASVDGDNIIFENEADLRPEVSIGGSPFLTAGGFVEEKDRPQFGRMFEFEVPRLVNPVPIRIRMRDDDEPDVDDWIDLDPAGGCVQDVNGNDPACTLELFFDTCCYSFTGDGITGSSGCPGGVCSGGGDGHWLGPGDLGERAKVRVRVETGNELQICPGQAGVAVTGTRFVQVVDSPGFAVGGRGAILRVTMSSTFDDPVTTNVVANIGDSIGPDATEEQEVTLESCLATTQNFFVSSPVVVNFSRAHYGAIVDPDQLIPATDCERINDGDPTGEENAIDILPARDLSVIYQRIYYESDCPDGPAVCAFPSILPAAAAAVEGPGADTRIRGIYPAPNLTSVVDAIPVPMPLPVPDVALGPRDEIQALSERAALAGRDRVVGLVPAGWIDSHGYAPIPLGTTGVSNGKIGPQYVIAESIPGEGGFTPAHELGHTFGLSDEPCSISDLNIFELWKCEDEYNTDVFPDRPAGGFQGIGFDVPRGLEAAGTCMMDNDPNAWISNTDFESLVRKMAPGVDPRVLVVTGSVTNDAGGELLAAVGLDEGIPDRNGPTGAPFSLILRDAVGASLGEYGIFDDLKARDVDGDDNPDEILGDYDDNGVPDRLPVSHPSAVDEDLDGIPDAVEHAEFTLRIPWPAATRSVDLVGPGGAVIDTLAVDDGAAPIIELLEPLGEVRLDPLDPAHLLVPVRWGLPGGGAAAFVSVTGSAPAAAPVQAVTILSSYDGGATWLPRSGRLGGNAFVIDARGIEAPLTMKLRVMALANGPAGVDTTVADMDMDGCPDPVDPSPTAPDTVDGDMDGAPDVCDRCLTTNDPLQTDADQDGYGDACDGDYDNDGIVSPNDDAGFQSCLGHGVVADPACYDRDFDGDGVVTMVDHDSFFMPLMARGMPGPSALVPDGDADGVGDAYDCAAGDPSAWKMPGELSGLTVAASPLGPGSVSISWDSMSALAGPGTVYDVITGDLVDLISIGNFGSPECLSTDDTETDDLFIQSEPPPSRGWWYLARGENVCGSGTWGDGSGSPDPRDPLDTAILCPMPTPVLSISKTDSPDPVMAGGNITYTLSWSNTGTAAATGVVLSDHVPANTAFVSATGGGTPDPSENVIWSLGTVPAGSSGTVQMVVRVTSPIANGTIITNDTYTIDSAETSPVSGPAVTTTVTSLPSLSVSKTDSPDPVMAGGNITYTLSWSNTGTAAATGVILSDHVPANTAFVSATGGGTPDPSQNVIWSLGTLPAGSSGMVQMVVRVGATVSPGSTILNSQYSIDSVETTPVAGPQVSTTVAFPPILAIDLDVSTPTVIDGARTLSPTTTTLDVGVIVDARGSTGIGDVARVAFGVINAFNTGGATVTSIVPLAITDIMPPAAAPNNATFAALAGEFQFGNAIVERGVPGTSFAGGPLQYARFRITFGTRPAGSTVRVFIGDGGPGSLAVRNGAWLDISGDRTADGTPVGGVAGSDQGPAAGIDYRDAVISF